MLTHKARIEFFLVFVLLALPHLALAQSGSSPLYRRDLVGAGEQALHDLNEHGISIQSTMIYDWSEEIADTDPNAGFGRYSFDVSVPVDGKKLWGLSGSAGMVRVRHHLNNFGDDCVGETQVFSNIDASPRTNLYEAWVEQRLFAEKLRFKLGKIDANTEFATVQSAGDFLNSSMEYSPTIIAFPTYPEPKLGFNAFYRPTANNSVGIGVFQTATAGMLMVAEPGRSRNLGGTEKTGRVSAGYWHLGGGVSRFDGSVSAGTNGFYSVVEQTLWRNARESNVDRKVAAYLQVGLADGHVSPFERHVGGGGVLQGVSRKRSQDSIGVATTWVRFSSEPAAGFEVPSELVLESYYKAVITKHVAIVQDFQFAHNPGGLRKNPDCIVITPRLVVTF